MARGHIYSTTSDHVYSLYSDCKYDLALLMDTKPAKGVAIYAQCQVAE